MNGSNLKTALVNTFARYFESVDKSFDKEKFITNCNVNGFEGVPSKDITWTGAPEKVKEPSKFNINEVEEALKRMPDIVKKTLDYDEEENS